MNNTPKATYFKYAIDANVYPKKVVSFVEMLSLFIAAINKKAKIRIVKKLPICDNNTMVLKNDDLPLLD
jgi:hypothetical protein